MVLDADTSSGGGGDFLFLERGGGENREGTRAVEEVLER